MSKKLTSRQREVLDLLIEGFTNREIGSKLGITEETVKNHVTNARERLGKYGTNRVELAIAVRESYYYEKEND